MPVLLRFIIAVFAKIFSKLFSMATVVFLGRAPSRDDSKISLIGVLSLYWLFVAASLLSPALANAAVPFLPNNPIVIQIASISLLIAIPLIVGWLTTKLQNYNKEEFSIKKQLLMAYPYTILLGFLIVALIVALPVIKAPLFLKGYKVENLKIMIHKGKYEEALGQIENILTRHEMRTQVRDPHKVLTALQMILVWVLESIFKRHMSKNMKIIEGKHRRQSFQITVHATDISMAANRETIGEVMALLSEELDETFMYFSWDDESQKIEDRIEELRTAMDDGRSIEESDITEMIAQLRTLGLSKEDWNGIRRQLYQLECQYYKTREPILQELAIHDEGK
ncbi:MAG TPA: hypothetical protein VFK33_11240 [Bacillales bacterium]|nr:hypothetical protein [Bacillales bacterium]